MHCNLFPRAYCSAVSSLLEAAMVLDKFGGTGDASTTTVIWELVFHSGGPFPVFIFLFFWEFSAFVQRQNDEPPKMVLEPVRVQGGSAVVVTNTSLSLHDLDTQSSELVFVVSQSPEHGMS